MSESYAKSLGCIVIDWPAFITKCLTGEAEMTTAERADLASWKTGPAGQLPAALDRAEKTHINGVVIQGEPDDKVIYQVDRAIYASVGAGDYGTALRLLEALKARACFVLTDKLKDCNLVSKDLVEAINLLKYSQT